MADRHQRITFGYVARCGLLLGAVLLIGLPAFIVPAVSDAQPQSQAPGIVPPPPSFPGDPVAKTVIMKGSALPFQGNPPAPGVIDPKKPVADLLPPAPKASSLPSKLFLEDLALVPELQIQEPLSAKDANANLQSISDQMAKIRHLNEKKRDSFMEALLEHRTDLRGMPYAMGDACRTKPDRSAKFTSAVAVVRQALAETGVPVNADQFWVRYPQLYQEVLQQQLKADADCETRVASAHVAALMQLLGPESVSLRKGLVRFLGGVPSVEATEALAKLAVFSAEEEVRKAAIRAISVRREGDYTPTLVEALRYPLPAVAKRAGEALVKLERKDLLSKLVDSLDEPDPRLPVMTKIDKKEVPVVRELVRINHHRNCVLCHAPTDLNAMRDAAVTFTNGGLTATPGTMKGGDFMVVTTTDQGGLTAPLPVPGQPLVPPSQGYGQGQPQQIFVRIDVTYLRQDFSVMQPVENPGTWPTMQRFDYLVRTRTLSDTEAAEYKTATANPPVGFVTPYQRAVLYVLRELTGRDAAPNGKAWREVLN